MLMSKDSSTRTFPTVGELYKNPAAIWDILTFLQELSAEFQIDVEIFPIPLMLDPTCFEFVIDKRRIWLLKF
jgi:hypothetical protein